MPKRLAALNEEAAAENGGRHTVEVAIEAIELVIRVDGEKHTMTPVREGGRAALRGTRITKSQVTLRIAIS